MKLFKQWEKKFSQDQIKECRSKMRQFITDHSVACKIDNHWYFEVKQWSQDFVQDCVYRVADVALWQLLRTSMKGLTTKEKLQFLLAYYHSSITNDASREQMMIVKCRIDNYIGALRRGGQLDAEYNIVR